MKTNINEVLELFSKGQNFLGVKAFNKLTPTLKAKVHKSYPHRLHEYSSQIVLQGALTMREMMEIYATAGATKKDAQDFAMIYQEEFTKHVDRMFEVNKEKRIAQYKRDQRSWTEN